jgi:hypothetical protein
MPDDLVIEHEDEDTDMHEIPPFPFIEKAILREALINAFRITSNLSDNTRTSELRDVTFNILEIEDPIPFDMPFLQDSLSFNRIMVSEITTNILAMSEEQLNELLSIQQDMIEMLVEGEGDDDDDDEDDAESEESDEDDEDEDSDDE